LDPVKLSRAGARRTSGPGVGRGGSGAGAEMMGGPPAVLIPTDISIAERKQCPQHNSEKMKHLVLATWKHGFQGQTPDRSAILVESQALQESLELDNGLYLVYHSARTKGYLSVLQLQLTPKDAKDIPASLIKVHIKITIEGIVHQQVFEADPDIRYTYAWDRLNEYRQRVYGITTATVKVGYEYEDCDLVWSVQTTQLAGHDMTSTDGINGWNLHVQHKYNYHAGILQKGDGNTVYLKYKPQVVTTVLGNGEQRAVECTGVSCTDGPASKQKLLAPKALTSGPDGTVYVADYNIIRKINTDSTVQTILKLNSSRVSYRFHLAHSTLIHELEQRQTVYVSHPETHQIIRIKKIESDSKNGRSLSDHEIENNWEPFIGNGKRCLPGDSDLCGDGGKAIHARLAYPKGIAVAADGKVYIADGTNIREVDEHGIIRTIIGHQHHRSTWRPMPCHDGSQDDNSNNGGGSMPIDQVQLNWPTELAISPLDGSLHIVDDNVVLKVTEDGQVKVVAGRPLHCPPPTNNAAANDDSSVIVMATMASLSSPQSISFAPNGDLFVAESDSQRINRVRKVSTDGRLVPVAGKDSPCNCLDASCGCFEPNNYLASKVIFSAISAIAVTPDSTLYIADQGNARVRAVSSSLPSSEGAHGSDTGVYEVPDPDANEAYVFNKFGQHMLTRDIMTGNILFRMTYTQATSNGKLSTLVDSYGQKVTLMRDYKGLVNAIQMTNGHKYSLKMSKKGYLETFTAPDGYTANFRYDRSSGLLKSKIDSGNLGYLYDYDEFGRLVKAVFPTGEALTLTFNLTLSGAAIDVKKNGLPHLEVLVQDQAVSTRSAVSHRQPHVVSVGSDKTLTSTDPRDQSFELTRLSHPVIAATSDPVMADSFPMTSGQRVRLDGNLVNEISWQYSVTTNGHRANSDLMNIRRTLKSNGENMLTVFYDKLQKREVIYAEENANLNQLQKTELMEIRYDSSMRPISWEPKVPGSFNQLKQSYDRFGNLDRWTWGDVEESYGYDQAGRLIAVTRGNWSLYKYSYSDAFQVLPKAVITGQGAIFKMTYERGSKVGGGGGLSSIQTPTGHVHSFKVRPSINVLRFQYQAPWSSRPYELLYDSSGRKVSVRLPSKEGERVTYAYDSTGQLRKVIAGVTESEFGYDGETGALESVSTRSGHHFNMRTRNKYHAGLLKEQKVIFLGSSSPDFSNAVFRYHYDANGRPSLMISGIGSGSSEKLKTYSKSFNVISGQIESISGLSISRPAFNKTVLQGGDIGYYKSVEYDGNGRVAEVVYGLKRKEMRGVKIRYDSAGRVKNKLARSHEGRMTEENFSYDRDGRLSKVWGPNNFDYQYDENGNMVGRMSGVKMVLQYGRGDRVENVVGGRNPGTVRYDDVTGCVSRIAGNQRFWHNSAGQLVQMVSLAGSGGGQNGDERRSSWRISLHYDHLGRIAAWTGTGSSPDDSNRANSGSRLFEDKLVSQFFYTDVTNPSRLTHVHNPRAGLTQRLLYDHMGHLVAIETTGDQKMLVATDVDGSPVLVYRPDGSIMKELAYSPFGKVVKDTHPSMQLPVGFRGGVVIPQTSGGLLFMPEEKRFYHVDIAQWLNPEWQKLTEEMESPFDIFVYRFRRNNPVSVKGSVAGSEASQPRPFSLKAWAKLFGYDLAKIANEKMLSSDSLSNMLPEFKIRNEPRGRRSSSTLVPDLSLMSGLESTVRSARSNCLGEGAGGGQMSFVRERTKTADQPVLVLNRRFASSPSSFGNGFLLSVMRQQDVGPRLMDGLGVANAVKGVVPSSVVPNVLESLLNGSSVLEDVSYWANSLRTVYYFAKVFPSNEDSWLKQISIDMDNVKRLSGEFSVSVLEIPPDSSASGSGKDLKISNDQLELHVLYGPAPIINRFRDAEIQKAAKESKKSAWKREQGLVKNGFTGYGDWTQSQRSELGAKRLSNSAAEGVRGYEAIELQPRNRFPQLVRDQANYGFISETSLSRRQLRKNRHGGKNRKPGH